jgi:hypothetical protein
MGTFAETVIVDYHLSCADQGKQTTIYRFHLQQTNGSLPFHFRFEAKKCKWLFSVSSIFCFWDSSNMATNSNGKWGPRLYSLICLLFAHRAKRSFVVFTFVEKETNEVICGIA